MEELKELYRQTFGSYPEGMVELQASGSHRRYYRMTGVKQVMGVSGTSFEENRAFLAMDRHFASKGIRVPAIEAVSEDGMRYLLQDLGDTLLFDAISQGRENGHYSEEERALLCKVISRLPEIQFSCEDFDWGICYPEPAFDERMILFDLNYFKYCFLKATGLEFNEILLQDDFDRLKGDLLSDTSGTFMYRDFQARNVMISDGEPWFIDFQGGRRGPIYYDLASFVWQARSRYPDDLRGELERSYIEALRQYVPDLDEDLFYRRYRLFILFRTLQVLGAYGFRGYFEKKPHFLGSVPFAIDNLRKLLRTPFAEYPYLNEVLTKLTTMHQFYEIAEDKRLEISIFSFSYKKGIPADTSGNGGGYVFDCRSINNPGKYDYYRQFNGTDPEVRKFLEDDGEILRFLDHVYALVDPHVERFIQRKFTHLQVCFGCTGGQHRSVYCAEHLAAHLSGRFDVKIVLRHRELNIEKIL